MMQLIEEETVKYSEILKKISLHGSLTYWKLKNKGFENCNTILKIKVLKGKTSYRPLSNIRRIETFVCNHASKFHVMLPTIIQHKKD